MSKKASYLDHLKLFVALLNIQLTWLDCLLQIDSGGFILLAGSNQILLKVYFLTISFWSKNPKNDNITFLVIGI